MFLTYVTWSTNSQYPIHPRRAPRRCYQHRGRESVHPHTAPCDFCCYGWYLTCSKTTIFWALSEPSGGELLVPSVIVLEDMVFHVTDAWDVCGTSPSQPVLEASWRQFSPKGDLPTCSESCRDVPCSWWSYHFALMCKTLLKSKFGISGVFSGSTKYGDEKVVLSLQR